MELVKFELEKVVIESVKGDMIYARLHWIDHKNRKLFKVCSAGDASVLALMSDAQIFVVKSVYDKMEDFTDYDQNLEEDDE